LANGREKDGAQPINEEINAIMVDNVNEMMFQGSSEWWTDSGLRKPPVGLAGSKYATLVPAFSGLGEKRVVRRRSSDVHCQDQDPASNHLAHDSTSTSTTNLKPEPETHLHLLQEVARSTPSNTSTSSSPKPIFPSTFNYEKALQRLLVLDKHAPIPVPVLPSSDHNNRLNTSPPRINLQDLLALPPSSSSPNASPPHYPHPRPHLSPSKPNANANPKTGDEEKKEDRNHEGVMRIPRGPKEYGFKGFGSNGGGLKGKRYDTLEAEIDEVNLQMPISARDVEVDEL
jgi:hypothetical protein